MNQLGQKESPTSKPTHRYHHARKLRFDVTDDCLDRVHFFVEGHGHHWNYFVFVLSCFFTETIKEVDNKVGFGVADSFSIGRVIDQQKVRMIAVKSMLGILRQFERVVLFLFRARSNCLTSTYGSVEISPKLTNLLISWFGSVSSDLWFLRVPQWVIPRMTNLCFRFENLEACWAKSLDTPELCPSVIKKLSNDQ